jgi:hypothetical protein
MDDIELDHFPASFENLLDDKDGFPFSLWLVDTHHFKIRLAMLHDQIDAILLIDYFIEFDHILVIDVDVTEDVYLIFEGCLDVMHEIGMGVFHRG